MSLGRRLVPDVCGYTVSRIASVDVYSAGNVLRLLSFVDHLLFFFFFFFFFFKWLRFSNTDEENTEMRIHFGLVTRIFWA